MKYERMVKTMYMQERKHHTERHIQVNVKVSLATQQVY